MKRPSPNYHETLSIPYLLLVRVPRGQTPDSQATLDALANVLCVRRIS